MLGENIVAMSPYLMAPQPARLQTIKMAPPPRPSSASKRDTRFNQESHYIGSLHHLVPRRPHSATGYRRTTSSDVVEEEGKNNAIVVKAPQAIRGFVPPAAHIASPSSPSPSPSSLTSGIINVDKPLPALKQIQFVSGMPTPPQTPENTAKKVESGAEQKGWITSIRRASLPKSLKKFVRASFATSTTTTIVTSPEQKPITCHTVETAQRGKEEQEAVPELQLGDAAVSKFDPSRDISLAFLETVPTYHYGQNAQPAIERKSSPSPTLIRPLCETKSDEAPEPRKRRRSKARVLNPEVSYKSILKSTSQFDKKSSIVSTGLLTPPSRSPTKQFRFNEQVLVGETWPRYDYERKSGYSLQLTPQKAYQIKKELNDFKRDEMAVHEESRCYTHFFP